MALEILHTRAEHTHENEQFRRIAKDLMILFEKMKWDGVLIGNPYNDDFSRFRADAFLYYTNGLIIIDLKDYAGEIVLPPNDREFSFTNWYIDQPKDKQRIIVKGGSYINPFKQLDSYRNTFKELIKSNLELSSHVNADRICIVNIFKGAIKINRETPGNIPYYKITDESGFPSLLYDFASPGTYSNEAAEVLKKIFPSEPWIDIHDLKSRAEIGVSYLELIDDDFETIISDFLKHPDHQILLLESGNTRKRDEWMQYILAEATNFNIPQAEVWTHSSRIAQRVKKRTGIEPQSLFCTIYSGNIETSSDEEIAENSKEKNEDEAIEKIPEQIQDNVGIKSDNNLDDKGLVILSEAHLVTRSLFQTELMRFGSGRLLEDLFTHVKLTETHRKLIFIGDPYSLSYGKEEESALSTEAIAQLFNGEILKYRDKFDDTNESAISKLRADIISSIDQRKFNNIQFEWDNKTLIEVDKSQTGYLFQTWFKKPFNEEPENAVLVFKNKDALKISQWIRKNIHFKNEDFLQGDLLLVDNNFNIPDETGLSYPQRIQNGMYLRVEEKLERFEVTIALKGKQLVTLKFIKLRVTCLSLKQHCQAEIWILENFFTNSYELTIDEQIAFRAFVNQRVEKQFKFEDSLNYKKLLESTEYQDLILKQNELPKALDAGEKVKKKLDGIAPQINKLKRNEKSKLEHQAFIQVLYSDPLVNAAYVQYAYAMTVHKAIGASFKEILFNTFQGENRGVINESYFRWLYTGISCALDSVKIINPVSINPLMNCVFEDTTNITNPDFIVKKKNSIIFPEIQVQKDIQSFSNTELPENVKRGATFLINLLQPHGYLFDKVFVGQYFLKIIFITPSGNELDEKDKLHIKMCYNGQEEISTVRVEKAGKSDRTTIEECLWKLPEYADTDQDPMILPDDFRKQVYQKWIEDCTCKGFQLKLTEEHPYQNVFIIKKDGIWGRFRIYFTDDGFFTKLVMIEKSTNELGNEIKEMLLNGNKA